MRFRKLKNGVHIREFDGNYENSKFQKDASIFAVFKAVYNGKGVTLFFDLQFLEVLGIVEENAYIYEILRKSWVRNMCVECKNVDLKF